MKVIDFYREGFFSTYVVSGSEESPAAYVIRVLRAADGSKAVNYEVFLRSLPDGPSDHTSVPVTLLPIILQAVSQGSELLRGVFQTEPDLIGPLVGHEYLVQLIEHQLEFGESPTLGSYEHSSADWISPSNTRWSWHSYQEVVTTNPRRLTSRELRFRFEWERFYNQGEITSTIVEVWERRRGPSEGH